MREKQARPDPLVSLSEMAPVQVLPRTSSQHLTD